MALAASSRLGTSRHPALVQRPAAPASTSCRSPVGGSRARPVLASASGSSSYFVVKNVFKVKEDSFAAFEEVWRSRESHLHEFPGFMQFAMLKCTNIPGKYVSETHWASKEDFEGWANSSQFKASHGQGPSKGGAEGAPPAPRPNTMTMLEGPPAPEFYETVTTTARN